MPNWNENRVVIDAPVEEVLKYFVQVKPEVGWKYRMFNMHLLFPDRFPEDDADWEKNWDYDWSVENTGSKWSPSVSIMDEGDEVVLVYDSARTPNNLTLLKLSELTGWWIKNEYEEEGVWFEGIYICENADVLTDEQGDFCPLCVVCEKKYWASEIDMIWEYSEWICKCCQHKSP